MCVWRGNFLEILLNEWGGMQHKEEKGKGLAYFCEKVNIGIEVSSAGIVSEIYFVVCDVWLSGELSVINCVYLTFSESWKWVKL